MHLGTLNPPLFTGAGGGDDPSDDSDSDSTSLRSSRHSAPIDDAALPRGGGRPRPRWPEPPPSSSESEPPTPSQRGRAATRYPAARHRREQARSVSGHRSSPRESSLPLVEEISLAAQMDSQLTQATPSSPR